MSEGEINPNAGTIVRDKLWFDDGFTMVPNSWVRDSKLSPAALGILARLLTHDPGFEISIDYLTRTSPVGRDVVTTALAEAERNGYLRRYRGRDRGRFGRIKWHLQDPHRPVDNHGSVTLDLEPLEPLRSKKTRSTPQTDFPHAVEPFAVKPHAENPETIEDHLEEHLTQDSETGSSTGAGIKEDGFAAVLRTVAEWAAEDLDRLVHQPCPYRRDGKEHDFAPGSGCGHCGIRPDQRWHNGEVVHLDTLRAIADARTRSAIERAGTEAAAS